VGHCLAARTTHRLKILAAPLHNLCKAKQGLFLLLAFVLTNFRQYRRKNCVWPLFIRALQNQGLDSIINYTDGSTGCSGFHRVFSGLLDYGL